MAAFIGDFGKNKDGLYLFRINGTKAEIQKAIQDIKDLGCEIHEEPIEFEKAYMQWSVLLKMWLPTEIEKEREKFRKEAKKSRRKF